MSGLIPFPGSSSGGGTAQRQAYLTGKWYPPGNVTIAAGGTQTKDVARFIPFFCTSDVTIAQLGVRITTLGLSTIQLAIYSNVTSDVTSSGITIGNHPGVKLAATGDIANTSTGDTSAAFASSATVACTAGTMYWLGINCNDSSATMICDALSSASVFMMNQIGVGNLGSVFGAGAVTLTNVQYTMTYNTWSDVSATNPLAITSSNGHAAIAFKVN